MSCLNSTQLRQLLKTITGERAIMEDCSDAVSDWLTIAQGNGRISLPFDPDRIYPINERFPVLADLRMRRSQLRNILTDNGDRIGLVGDSVLTGKEGLFFCALLGDKATLSTWITCAGSPELLVTTSGPNEFMVAATVRSFVPTLL